MLLGIGLSGSAALIYELVWLRSLSYILGNTTYAATTMLASFMAGLALGSFWGGKVADRSRDHLFLFGFIELLIGLFGLVTLYLIKHLDFLYAFMFYQTYKSFYVLSAAQFLFSFVLMLFPTTLMGMTFPIVLKKFFSSELDLGRRCGYVYAINTAGAVLGVILAGFIMLPLLGITKANMIAVVTNFVIAMLTIFYSKKKKIAFFFFPLFLLLALFINAYLGINADRYFSLSFYNANRWGSYRRFLDFRSKFYLVYSAEGAEGKVQVFNFKTGNNLNLVRNGMIEGTRNGDIVNEILLAGLPLAYRERARSFLNIGIGTGTTLWSAEKLGKKLNEIYCLEIDPNMAKAASIFYPELFRDNRLRVIYQDARNFLKFNKDQKFDIISSEPSYPTGQVEGSLFTYEFFKLAKSRLNPNGIYVQWIPYWLFGAEGTQIVIKTFGQVFPYMHTWHMESKDIILIGSLKNDLPAADIIRARILSHLDNRYEYGFSFGRNENELRKRVLSNDIKVNTDDSPILEFLATRNMESFHSSQQSGF